MNVTNEISTLNVSADLSVSVLASSDYGFLMTTNDVAKGYGISRDTVHAHKSRNSNEFVEGVHFVKGLENCKTLGLKNSQPNQIYWTKVGVIRLGFFISSERAKVFRDWAEQVVLEYVQHKAVAPTVKLPQIRRHNHNRLNKDRLVEILGLVALVEDKEVRTALVKKLMPNLEIPSVQLQLPFEVKGGGHE